jgi:hypothetical protein
MAAKRDTYRVAVGIDGSPDARRAAELALHEAAVWVGYADSCWVPRARRSCLARTVRCSSYRLDTPMAGNSANEYW